MIVVNNANNFKNDSFKYYKKCALGAAKDLHYGQEVIDRVELAETEGEIERIMHDARKREN